MEERHDEIGAVLSPNGRLVAYQSDADGRPEIYVRILGSSSGRWQVSNAGGEEPMWSPDGKFLYYRYSARLMRVPIVALEPFQAGLPAVLFEGIYEVRSDTNVSYHPHPKEPRILMTRIADVTASGSIRVMTRWFDELRKIK